MAVTKVEKSIYSVNNLALFYWLCDSYDPDAFIPFPLPHDDCPLGKEAKENYIGGFRPLLYLVLIV